ncbi:hypothetical protein HK102_006058, partial [Quaeritorhiza haematococci]
SRRQPTPTSTMSVVDLTTLRQEYTLVLAKLQLSSRYPELESRTSALTPQDALVLYVRAEMFDAALSLGKMFEGEASGTGRGRGRDVAGAGGEGEGEGYESELDLAVVFEAMAERCCEFAKADLRDCPIETDPTLLTSDPPLTWEGTVSERSWRLLRTYLERHDGKHNGYRYRRCVIEKLLQVDVEMRIPVWLTAVYEHRNPEDLVRLYLKYNLVEEATRLIVRYIRQQTSQLPGALLPRTSARWLPYTLIDQLQAALHEAVTGRSHQHHQQQQKVLKNLEGELKEALGMYFERVRGESETIVRYGAEDGVMG